MKFDFEFENSYGDKLLGHKWIIDNPKANIILTTGMQEHSNRYDHFANYLNEQGYNVYCIDHYGQGENVKEGRYGIVVKNSFFKMADTLFELQLNLEAKENIPVYLISHSMGSFIAQSYMQRHKHICKKVILIGSSSKIPMSGLGFFLAKMLIHKKNWEKPSKFFTSLSVGSYAKTIKKRKYEAEWISYNMDNVIKYTADPACNYICSGGFYYNLLQGTSSLFKKKNVRNINKDTHILILSGDADAVSANSKRTAKLEDFYKKCGHDKVNLKIYENMRHEVLNEDNKNQVYNDIVKFLNL